MPKDIISGPAQKRYWWYIENTIINGVFLINVHIETNRVILTQKRRTRVSLDTSHTMVGVINIT